MIFTGFPTQQLILEVYSAINEHRDEHPVLIRAVFIISYYV